MFLPTALMKYSMELIHRKHKNIIRKTAMPVGSIFIVNMILFFTGILNAFSENMLLQKCWVIIGGPAKRKKHISVCSKGNFYFSA
jgi:hypothetical protein